MPETLIKHPKPILLKEIVSGCSSRKVILHLCADLGSDSLFYQLLLSAYIGRNIN